MAFKTRLRGIFGWSSNKRPMSRPTLKDIALQTQQVQSAADRYHSEMDFLHRRRQDRYDVYDAMDNMSDVASVLDAYAEDAVQLDPEHKKSVWVTAKKTKTKKLLNSFLHETLNTEDYVEGLCRDVAKMGDDFALVKAQRGKGVTSLVWRDPRDIERIENLEGILIGFEETALLGSYRQRVNSERQQGRDGSSVKPSYEPWDVIHFRIFKKKRLPKEKKPNIYGTSVLAGSERVAKQVKILDDLLMIMRLTRSLDRYTYYVDVGRSPVEEEVNILRRWKQALKRKTYFDPATGQFDSRFDPYAWCITGDTKISLLDGRERTVEQLVEEYGTDKSFWVYSRDKEGYVVPGKAKCVGKTRLDAELVKVTLDNGQSVRCTPDHRWMLKDGSYKEAEKLTSGDSLSPLYRSVNREGYETFLQKAKRGGRWDCTHIMVAEAMYGAEAVRYNDPPLDYTGINNVHHLKKHNNNSPECLVLMGKAEHMEEHRRLRENDPVALEEFECKRIEALRKSGYSPARAKAMRVRWEDPCFKSVMSQAVSESWNDENSRANRVEAISSRNKRLWRDQDYREMMKRSARKELRRRYLELVEEAVSMMVKEGFDPMTEWDIARDYLMTIGLLPPITPKWEKALGYIELGEGILGDANHKVDSVEFLSDREDTYDITVKDHNNFALTAGVFIHNSEDIFWSVKENRNSRVEVQQGITNISDIVDIDHFRDKFFGSLRAPKAYFGYDGEHNSKASLSSQSLKWSKAVTSIQRAVKQGLTRLCQIHLAYLGLDTNADQFEVHMTPPSIVELLDKLEAWQNVVDVAERMSTLGETLNLDKYDWTVYILENVMWLSKDEVKKFTKKIPKDAPQEEPDDQQQKPTEPPQPFDTPFTKPGGQPQPADVVGKGPKEPEEKPQAQPEEGYGANGKSTVQLASMEVDKLLLEIKDYMEARVN